MTTPTFFDHPTHYTVDEFRTYIAALRYDIWNPAFPTLHNTGMPSLKQWTAMGATPQDRWGANLNRYYEGKGWHAGPHIVVCPDYVWVLCDLTKSGVSVSCYNSLTFGIEMVGDYEVGGDDFSTGLGAKVRDNAAAVLAVLTEKFIWSDLADFEIGVRGLHFHHDCAEDHHACPGSKVTKLDMITRAKALARPLPVVPAAVLLPMEETSAEHRTTPAINSVEDIQAALNLLEVEPVEPIDGAYGPLTIQRVREFQTEAHCQIDGWAGVETKLALEAAIKAKFVS